MSVSNPVQGRSVAIPVPPKEDRSINDQISESMRNNSIAIADVKRHADAEGDGNGMLTRDEFDRYERKELGPEFLGVHWLSPFNATIIESSALGSVATELKEANGEDTNMLVETL